MSMARVLPWEECVAIMLGPCPAHAQDVELALGQAYASQVEAVAPEALQGVDAHASQHVLDLQAPAAQEVHQATSADVWVDPLAEDGVGGADAPGAAAGVALLADGAAQGDEGGRADVDGIGAQGDRLDHVGARAEAAGGDDRRLIADALFPQARVDGGDGQFDGNADVVADDLGGGSGGAPQAVDGDDVGARAYDAAGDGRRVVDGGGLVPHRLLSGG